MIKRQVVLTIIGSCFYLAASYGSGKLNGFGIALVGIANVLFMLR